MISMIFHILLQKYELISLLVSFTTKKSLFLIVFYIFAAKLTYSK
jgi:hypothetical protein